jgi:hypothetical protein
VGLAPASARIEQTPAASVAVSTQAWLTRRCRVCGSQNKKNAPATCPNHGSSHVVALSNLQPCQALLRERKRKRLAESQGIQVTQKGSLPTKRRASNTCDLLDDDP